MRKITENDDESHLLGQAVCGTCSQIQTVGDGQLVNIQASQEPATYRQL